MCKMSWLMRDGTVPLCECVAHSLRELCAVWDVARGSSAAYIGPRRGNFVHSERGEATPLPSLRRSRTPLMRVEGRNRLEAARAPNLFSLMRDNP